MKQGLIIFFCLIFLSLAAQPVSIFNMMQQDSIVDLFVEVDWKQLVKEKNEKEYLPAHIKFRASAGDSIALEGKVRTRGNMRLNICTYAPLKLKFDKNELVAG